jgi:microcystin-dependent protein
MTSCLLQDFAPNARNKPTIGDTKMSVISRDHIGWLNCDGRLLNVNDFYQLWEVVGYSFGGSGTQFRLPDMGGRVAGTVGDDGTGREVWSVGDVSGAQVHVLTIPQMPIHNHTGQTDLSGTGITLTDPGHTHSITPGGNAIAANGGSAANNSGGNTSSSTTGITLTDPRHRHSFTTNNTGGSLPHQNIQPTLFIGNTFIYSGKPNYGTYPNTINTNVY